MATKLARMITQKLIASSIIESGDRDLYCYGFFLLISKVFFFFVTVTAGLLAGILLESILFYTVFISLRSYAGGIHARTEMICTILTTLVLIASVLIIKQLEQHTSGAVSLLILGAGSLYIFAFSPLDTDKKPHSKDERKYYKRLCVVILTACNTAALIAHIIDITSIFFPILCGICLESILLVLGKINEYNNNSTKWA